MKDTVKIDRRVLEELLNPNAKYKDHAGKLVREALEAQPGGKVEAHS